MKNKVKKLLLRNTKYLNTFKMYVDSWQYCNTAQKLVLFCGLYLSTCVQSFSFIVSYFLFVCLFVCLLIPLLIWHQTFLKKILFYLFIIFLSVYFWERERERKYEWGRGRERGREKSKQAPLGLNPPTVRSGPELNQESNQESDA